MTQDTKFVIGIIVACVVIFAGIFLSSGKSIEEANVVVDDGILVREDSPTIEGDGSVTLVEFLDPECGACASYHPLVKQVLEEYEGELTYVLRYFPLHSNSVASVQALEAAGEQNKYWEMLDVIFENQSEWSAEQGGPVALFKEYALELELDIDAFSAVVDSDKYQDKVSRDRIDGVAADVQGTPTFFINGKKLQNSPRNLEEFKSYIDAAKQS